MISQSGTGILHTSTLLTERHTVMNHRNNPEIGKLKVKILPSDDLSNQPDYNENYKKYFPEIHGEHNEPTIKVSVLKRLWVFWLRFSEDKYPL